MDVESRRRRHRDNKDTCSFSQDLCVKFDVIFTVDAEIDEDSIRIECGD